MKYSVAALTLAATAMAKPAFLNTDFDVVEGQPFTLEFSGCEDTCSIILKNGPSDNLDDVQVLDAAATGESATITLSNIPTDTYAFEIVDNVTGENNYSPQFEVDGSGEPAPTTTEPPAKTDVETVTETATTEEITTTEEVTSTEEVTTTVGPSSSEETESATTLTTVTNTTETETATETETETASPTETDDEEEDGDEEESTPTTIPDSGAGFLASPLSLVLGAAAMLVLVQ